MKRSSQISGLLGWVTITFAAAALGAWASTSAATFYATLALPGWAPPASVFGPVWTLLYAMMAIAAWLAWRERGWRGARPALVLYLVQLAVNALWSWLFFGWRLGALAFADILLLIVLVCATIVTFARTRPIAGCCCFLTWPGFRSPRRSTLRYGEPIPDCCDKVACRSCLGNGLRAPGPQQGRLECLLAAAGGAPHHPCRSMADQALPFFGLEDRLAGQAAGNQRIQVQQPATGRVLQRIHIQQFKLAAVSQHAVRGQGRGLQVQGRSLREVDPL